MKLNLTPIIFIFLAVFSISSCTKTEEAPPRISQDQLTAISGMYNLTSYIISPPQDLNDDEVFSEDLMNELDCLNASLILREDLSYSLHAVQLSITFITNDQYVISCEDSRTTNGIWDLNNNQILLSQGEEGSFAMNGSTLTRTEGKNLPDFQRMVFEKQ